LVVFLGFFLVFAAARFSLQVRGIAPSTLKSSATAANLPAQMRWTKGDDEVKHFPSVNF
jgi:hypothetical protein